MGLIVWVVIGVFVTTSGVSVDTASQPFKTETECRAVIAAMAEQVKDREDLLAYGQQCVAIKILPRVADSVKPKMSVPKKGFEIIT